jgi:hypothetical protein
VEWDEALDFIATEFTRIRAAHGPEAIAFYVSGQFLTEDYYVANKLMKGFIGAGNIDTNSRLCMSSSVAGHVRAFGEDIVPGCYDDLEEADLVIQVGSNMAWCHPVLYQRLMAAREKRGTKIVAIDPHRHGRNLRPASGVGTGQRCPAVERIAGLSGRPGRDGHGVDRAPCRGLCRDAGGGSCHGTLHCLCRRHGRIEAGGCPRLL